MKKFHFKFATLLELRKNQEDEALRALGAAQGALQEELQIKSKYQRELQESLKRREELGQGSPVPPSAFLAEQDFISGTRQRILRTDQAIFRARKGVEKALRAYLISKKRSRILETLNDQAHAEYKREAHKREQKEMDDANIMRFRLKEEVA